MEDVAKYPYVARRGTVFYYRRKVPSDLREKYAPKAEIIFSLKTSDPREAQRKANVETVWLDEEFEALRNPKSDAPAIELSNYHVRTLAEEHYRRLLEEDDELRFQGTGDAEVFLTVSHQLQGGPSAQAGWHDDQAAADFGFSERDYDQITARQEMLRPHLRKALSRGDISVVFDDVDELLEEHGLSMSRDTQSYRRLAMEVLKATVKAHEAVDKRLRGEVVETPASNESVTAGPTSQRAAVTSNTNSTGVSCSQLWDQYTTERQLPPKTLSDFGAYMRRFIELHGDLPLTEVTRSNARAFRDAMLKYPARPSGDLRSLPVPQVLERLTDDTETQRLSPRTVNQKAIGALRSVFAHAVENDLLQDNPFKGIKAAETSNNEPSRIPYTVNDLNLIFSTPVFASGERPTAAGGEAAKWLPLLAFFTGARLEELGLLILDDVLTEEDVQHIFIRAGKTPSARRRVPIHSELVRLGFLQYVDEMRGKEQHSLWPKLRSKDDKVTAGFSKWYGRYMRRHGLSDRRKVFHSFRHLVKRQLRNAHVDKGIRDALQGHAAGDIADSVYGLDEEGLGFALPVLKQAIEKLEYPGLNLQHLYSQAHR